MLEEKLARIRMLMTKRDEIDAELATLLGISGLSKRGRPRKGQGTGSSAETVPTGQVAGSGSAQSTANGSDAE